MTTADSNTATTDTPPEMMDAITASHCEAEAAHNLTGTLVGDPVTHDPIRGDVVSVRRRPRAAVLVAATAMLAMPLSGCGSDETDVVAGPVELTAVDYSFQNVPERVGVGATLTMQNASTSEVHELVAIRLPDDEKRSVADLVRLPPDELAAFFPNVETVLVAPPGEAAFAVEGTGELARPGRYALICVIPKGADPAEYLAAAAEAEGGPPDVAGGPPHIVDGMFAELVVG